MRSPLAALEAVVTGGEPPDYALAVVNRTEGDPIQRILEETFADQPVTVSEIHRPTDEADVVVLLRDGEVVATSPLQAVMDACLLVNSDRYRTGTRGFDDDATPTVVTNLDEAVFRLRGYPASNGEKLLLILVSRFVERRALDADAGTLRTTFQQLSRIDRELGTRRVYDRLAATDVDVHVYGVPDRDPPADWGPTVHAGRHEGYRRAWCVVFVPPAGAGGHAALVALETGPNEWLGTWTYRPPVVTRTAAILERAF